MKIRKWESAAAVVYRKQTVSSKPSTDCKQNTHKKQRAISLVHKQTRLIHTQLTYLKHRALYTPNMMHLTEQIMSRQTKN